MALNTPAWPQNLLSVDDEHVYPRFSDSQIITVVQI